MPYPQTKLNDVSPAAVTATLTDLLHIKKSKVADDAEVEERINAYFDYCTNSGLRPTIESLALCLGTTRMTLSNWARGINCSKRRQELIEAAKQTITAYLAQLLIDGGCNPVSCIFALKNWANYTDKSELELSTNNGAFDEVADSTDILSRINAD